MRKIDWARTTWFVAGAGLLTYEVIALIQGKPNSTLSEAVWDTEKDAPYIPFFAGVLCGHFFWQRTPPKPKVG